MSILDERVGTLELLERHEKALSKLYQDYSKIFPGYEEFWEDLSQEELMHADWMEQLSRRTEEGTVFINENRFRIQAIMSSFKYIEDLQKKAETEPVTLLQALSQAFYLELALLEKKFFEIAETDSVEVKRTMSALAESTKTHSEKIRVEWEKYL